MTTTEQGAPPAVALEAFREAARALLEANAPRRARRGDGDDADVDLFGEADHTAVVAAARDFQSRLHAAGFAGITWPVEYGGRGLPADYQRAFDDEAAAYELPTGMILVIGLGMCGPTILTLGTDEQRRRFIPPLLSGEHVWCQLFSEPGAGSDVASLQTRAERDGDEWIVNGQKVWTSGAHYSDYGMLIARSDPGVPKHRGITMMAVPMTSPGITVRPLRQITGAAHFNEVFFDDVRVPAANVIGDVDEGWRGALTMLANERVALGGSGRRGGGNVVEGLIRHARERGLAAEPVVRQRLADLWIRHRIIGFTAQRISAAVRSGRMPGPEGSVAKLAGTQLNTAVSDFWLTLAGPAGAAWDAGDMRAWRRAERFLGAPAGRIAGGSDEVQRNIIGERVLGLPKEPQVDRDIPFRDLKVGTQRPA